MGFPPMFWTTVSLVAGSRGLPAGGEFGCRGKGVAASGAQRPGEAQPHSEPLLSAGWVRGHEDRVFRSAAISVCIPLERLNDFCRGIGAASEGTFRAKGRWVLSLARAAFEKNARIKNREFQRSVCAARCDCDEHLPRCGEEKRPAIGAYNSGMLFLRDIRVEGEVPVGGQPRGVASGRLFY